MVSPKQAADEGIKLTPRSGEFRPMRLVKVALLVALAVTTWSAMGVYRGGANAQVPAAGPTHQPSAVLPDLSETSAPPLPASPTAGLQAAARLLAGSPAASGADAAAIAGSPAPPRTFVVLGDSLSVWAFAPGASHPCKTCAWPTLLAVHQADFTLVHNGGVAGNTTTQMVARIRRDVLAYHADLLIVLAGTNDVGDDYYVSSTLANIRTIERSARTHGYAVVLLTMPPNNADTAGRLARLRATNAALFKMSKVEGFAVIDIYSPLATASGHLRPGYAAADGLHLSIAGEQKVAETVYAALMGASSSSPNSGRRI
jgi:lysophospholipase L1-like esterase